jgi:hypothetical protein
MERQHVFFVPEGKKPPPCLSDFMPQATTDRSQDVAPDAAAPLAFKGCLLINIWSCLLNSLQTFAILLHTARGEYYDTVC